MTSHDLPSRLIDIPGCYNLRDVGGYQAHGGTTRWRTLLRSASPHRTSAHGWEPLCQLGIGAMIDLRRPKEAAREAYVDRLVGEARYIGMPLFDDSEAATVDYPTNNLSELYRSLLAHCGPRFAAVLRTISAEPGAVLVHCAVGKDRTGLVIALALAGLGVDHETIATDYSLSYEQLVPLHAAFLEEVRAEGGDVERVRRMLEARHETMLDTLAHLDEQYGGVGGYFEQIHFSATDLAALRAKLVTASL